ncbi:MULTISPECIES: helix-turn-helix transcriptional regulator [unclassified Rhizobium]|jgi:DNA-binding CsgD family transcriptional regulator|uniref:response regulator transcription factor n=1 Tax=unclassified Rhizobium TaxID=2613769 RepID=UPI000648B0C7|nr:MULTISPECIES: helix-turn-helix transcriptional regulator [unclassified Rhizobium]OJY65577.1 MAG: hypothetical protein BGP09_21665 [Rhizobium sp. 60-20]RKD35769.1 regulatory LuxR family protein [Rhizobium sp. WW_1]
MSNLDHKEWARINDITLIIHGTKSLAEMRKFFLEAIRLLVPYEKAMFYLADTSSGDVTLHSPVFVNVDAKFAKAYEESVQSAVFGRVAINTHRSIAYRDTDIMSEAVRINSDVYNSLLSPNDVPFGGGVIVTNDGHPTAELTLLRTKRQGDFTAKDLFIFDVLKNHLEIRFAQHAVPATGPAATRDVTAKLVAKGLTGREVEIVELIARGTDSADIADKLSISVFTVKRHIHNVFAKLKVKKRTHLVSLLAEL